MPMAILQYLNNRNQVWTVLAYVSFSFSIFGIFMSCLELIQHLLFEDFRKIEHVTAYFESKKEGEERK